MPPVVWICIFFLVQRGAEVWVSERNARRSLAAGGVEYGRGHYPAMVLLHAGWQAGFLVEALWIGGDVFRWPWAALALIAQGLRYASMSALGPAWSARVVVIPGRAPVVQGPYRYLRHPNYWGVVLELAAVPLIVDAWRTAVVASLLNAWLLFGVRIPCEDRALHGPAA